MGVHILWLFLSAAGPLEEQKHTPGTAQQTTPRGGRARTKSPWALWKVRPGKGSQSQGSAGMGIKKAPGKQNKREDNEASVVFSCMS